LDRDDSLPLEEGLTAGNSSIFFKEFFLIKFGLFYVLLASAYKVPTNASRLAITERTIFAYVTI
jgi:hypothetical protein